MLQEDIIWHRHQTLCSVSHRGSRSQYHFKSSFLNKTCASLPLCVPVPLLLLELDWPLSTISPMYTLYGCPRLLRGPQVRCQIDQNTVYILRLYRVRRLRTHLYSTPHLRMYATTTPIVLSTWILYELATIGTANLQYFIQISFLISEFGSLSWDLSLNTILTVYASCSHFDPSHYHILDVLGCLFRRHISMLSTYDGPRYICSFECRKADSSWRTAV